MYAPSLLDPAAESLKLSDAGLEKLLAPWLDR
ncbi:hypothetical protein RAM_10155 [Amycolatopsis mediterranei S699]|uniref:Uncharacterized protein n=1 Tax=Amycolatopsis mediterranei (strain S699) TaxID=713604 RepID=A0A9R0NTU1_AMYMS|nr:hypothetical protein RAM_10155 [Amycolatopsis mediterranei S699]